MSGFSNEHAPDDKDFRGRWGARGTAGTTLLLVVASLTCPNPARADETEPATEAPGGPRLRWDPDWAPVEPWEAAVGFGFFAGSVVVAESVATPTPRVTRAWLWDPWVRNGLALPSRDGRDRADRASDWTLLLTLGAPLLIDDLVTVAILDDQPSLALRMAILDLEALAFALFLGTTTQHVVRRARPFRRECDEDPEYSGSCGSNGANLSFFSIHTTTAFTGAGLLCLHHTEMPLFGGGAADAATCGMGLGVAALTGTLRMMADRHWSTDVLAGAAVGLASGWLLPWLIHFRPGAGADDGAAFLPWIEPGPGTYGLRHVRAF